jgi:nucleotide-binding universal stress UspA family protein
MRYFEHVVVALAMAPVDRDLVRYARMVADLGGGQTRLTFTHVLPTADVAAQGGGPPGLSLGEARAALKSMLDDELGPSSKHDLQVVSAHLIDALLTEATEIGADLLLVGHRKNSRGRRSLSRRLALKASCSVWMVPEGSPPKVGRVLAGVDLSQPSAQALSLAANIASRAGLQECTVLHVQTPSPLGYDRVDREGIEHALNRFLSPLELHGTKQAVRIEESGSVSRAIEALVEKEHFDLVVVGTRGRSPSAAVLLGSESESVLQESRVPVLVTKEPGERVGLLRALLDREFRFRGGAPRFG